MQVLEPLFEFGLAENFLVRYGLVARIARSHRVGRGSIPRIGVNFVFITF